MRRSICPPPWTRRWYCCSLLHFSSSCQYCQHSSVSEDFSWQNSEATFWHLQQTNCCLLPLQLLWSPNELVSPQEMRKGTHKINLSGYYALSSAKTKTCWRQGEKVEEMGLWEKVTEHPSSLLFWLFSFFAHFHTHFPPLKDTLWQALWSL